MTFDFLLLTSPRRGDARLGLIAGTGMEDFLRQPAGAEVTVPTPYGECRVVETDLADGLRVLLVVRHGHDHRVPPHRVNYRSQIWALRERGAAAVLGINAVGALDTEIPIGTVVLVDQFLDFTRQRASTFFDGPEGPVVHTNFTVPYCPTLRAAAAAACEDLAIPHVIRATYVCAEGPRYECPAEIRMYRQLGGDVVGMTGLPEVVLAREAGLCYACLSVVTNVAAGTDEAPSLTHQEVETRMRGMRSAIGGLIRGIGTRQWNNPECLCRRP